MTLPTGQISMSQVNTELGLASTTTISLNQTNVRTLAGVPSGQISMSNLQGKSNQFAFTISTNQTNANLRTLAVNAGWNQSSKVVATINSGVYISSNSTGTPALTVNGSFPGGVELVNGGIIVGMGGNGGRGADWQGTNQGSGAPGGGALSVSSAITITNNGTIAGGGGGGGGGGRNVTTCPCTLFQAFYAGGGGGGGRSSNAANSSGGGAGTSSGLGSAPQPGGAGTLSSAGSGGTGQAFPNAADRGGTGGTGGGWGSAGNSGETRTQAGASGGSGGYAVSGNSNISWVATGTRLGSIS